MVKRIVTSLHNLPIFPPGLYWYQYIFVILNMPRNGERSRPQLVGPAAVTFLAVPVYLGPSQSVLGRYFSVYLGWVSWSPCFSGRYLGDFFLMGVSLFCQGTLLYHLHPEV